jgi:hypothetical protein
LARIASASGFIAFTFGDAVGVPSGNFAAGRLPTAPTHRTDQTKFERVQALISA